MFLQYSWLRQPVFEQLRGKLYEIFEHVRTGQALVRYVREHAVHTMAK